MHDLIKAHAGLLAVALTTFVLMGAGQAIYGPALPAFARDFGLDTAGAGWLVSAHWIGCILGVGLMYLHGATVSPRVVLVMMAAGAGIVAAGTGFAGALVGAVVFGIGYGCATVVFNPRMLRAFGPRGPAMLAMLNAMFSVGAILSPLVFVWLGSVPVLAFGLIAAGCAVVSLAAGFAQSNASIAPVATLPFRFHTGILAFGAVAIGVEACLIGLGPTALIRAGQTEDRAAELLSLFFLAFLVARIGLVFLASVVKSFTLFTIALIVATTLAFGAALIDPGLFFVGIGLCTGVFFPSFFITASRLMGDDPRVTPTIIAAGLVGGILSPVLVGAIIDTLGPRGFFWVAGCALAAAALAAVLNLQRINNH